MRKIELAIAQADLPRLVEEVADGEEVMLAMAGKPVARLVPLESRPEPSRPGLMKGQIWIADDFDEPLPKEVMAAFRGERP